MVELLPLGLFDHLARPQGASMTSLLDWRVRHGLTDRAGAVTAPRSGLFSAFLDEFWPLAGGRCQDRDMVPFCFRHRLGSLLRLLHPYSLMFEAF